jgi:hypothetical protein
MKKISERFTFIILIALILISFIQLRILWNHRFLFGLTTFFSDGKSTTQIDYNIARNEFFTPYDVIVSEGIDKYCAVITDKGNQTYKKLWNEAKEYLKTIINTNKSQAVFPESSLNVDEWAKLTANKSITFEFKTNIKLQLLSWFLGEQYTSPQVKFTGLYKMIICPYLDNVNDGICVIYIRDDKRIYKYTVNTNLSYKTWMKIEDYNNTFNKIDKDLTGITKYNIIKTCYPEKLSYGPDLLGVANGPAERPIGSITCSTPEGLRMKGVYIENEFDDIAKRIIGPEMDGYNRSIDSRNTIEYTNQNNVYRVYGDGLVEYKYLPEVLNSDKGEPGEAFQNAYKFISRLTSASSNMLSGVRLYLSYFYELSDCYEFGFDYVLYNKINTLSENSNGIPIFITYKPLDNDIKLLEHAITVKSNSKSVIECYSLLKTFKVDKFHQYNVSFPDLMDKASKDINGFNKLQINEAIIAYKIHDVKSIQSLIPVWELKTKSGNYSVPMF